MNVLLIEPDMMLGGIYKTALEGAGYTVELHRHAQAAVFATENVCPDLVILELQLPGHGGVEFLYEFRSYPDWQSITVLLHTWVNENSLDFNSLNKLGIDGYLYKPVTTLRKLIHTVHGYAPANA